jgi:hypothetical protein
MLLGKIKAKYIKFKNLKFVYNKMSTIKGHIVMKNGKLGLSNEISKHQRSMFLKDRSEPEFQSSLNSLKDKKPTSGSGHDSGSNCNSKKEKSLCHD